MRGLRAALANPFLWLLVLVGGLLIGTGVSKWRYAVALQTGRERYPDIEDIGNSYALIGEGIRLGPWYVTVGLLCIVAGLVTVAIRVGRP